MIASAHALQLKHWLENSKTAIRWGTRVVVVDGLEKPLPLTALAERLLELSTTLPKENGNGNLRDRITALRVLERIRLHYRMTDAQLEARCCLWNCCKKSDRIRPWIEKNVVELRLRGFTEEYFHHFFPGKALPLDCHADSEIGDMLYLVKPEEIEALFQEKPKSPPSQKRSQGWRLFKKLSR